MGNRLQDAERVRLDYDLMTLRRRLARAFLNGDTAEAARTRAEITELEGRRGLSEPTEHVPAQPPKTSWMPRSDLTDKENAAVAAALRQRAKTGVGRRLSHLRP